MITSFSALNISYIFSTKLSLIKETYKKIYSFRDLNMIRPNNRCKCKCKFWTEIKHLLRLFNELRIRFWSFLYYLSYLFNRNGILRLNYISRIHSLTNRWHLYTRLVWRLDSICIEIFGSRSLITICISFFKGVIF